MSDIDSLNHNKSKILYDGNCIVCDIEITRYNQMSPDQFDIIDISSPDFDAEKYGLTQEAVNRKMHVLTPSGEIKIGVDAFAHIWSRMDKFKFAGKIIQLPVIHLLARIGYRIFASIRHLLPKKKR